MHAVLSLDVGGLERIVVDLLREGQRLGQETAVLCIERPGDLAPLAAQLGAKMFCAHKRPGTRPSIIGKTAQMLEEFQPDVVHTHQIAPLFYVGRAARRAGVPLVVHTEHGKNYARRWRSRLLGRLAARRTQKFFCVSNDIAGEVLAARVATPSKVQVIVNGIDPTRFSKHDQRDALRRSLAIPHDAPVVGTVGRLTDVKRQDLLIRSFAMARRTDPRLQLLIVGDGPRGDDLRALSSQLNVASAVHFVGYQPQPERYFQMMDLFALTSRSEGMPLSVLEAWAASVAVVGSRVGGIPELIEHGKTGLLFHDGDERALAGAITMLAHDREYAKQLADAGRRRVRAAFHIRATARAYHEQYLGLLGHDHSALPQLA
ncbi:glycosyltransferase [soil metagenome]